MSRYNRYPVSGMTDVQIYTGKVSIQYRDTTTYRYTAHPCFSLCGLRYIVKENMQNKLYNRSPFIKYVCTNLKLQEHKM